MIYQEKAHHRSKGQQVKGSNGRHDHGHQHKKQTMPKSSDFSSSSPSSSQHGRDTYGDRAERAGNQNGKRKFQPVNPNARELVSWSHSQQDAEASKSRHSANKGPRLEDRSAPISQHSKYGVRPHQQSSRLTQHNQYTHQDTGTRQLENQPGVLE